VIFREIKIECGSMEGKKNQLYAVSTTRWSSHSTALNVVLKFHNAVLKTVIQINDSEGSAHVVVV